MTVPEEKNPWLRLARLSEDHEENKRLWNGYQKYLLKPNEEDYQRQMEIRNSKRLRSFQIPRFMPSKPKYKTSPRSWASMSQLTWRQTSKKSKCR
jgi:hypothetical protein